MSFVAEKVSEDRIRVLEYIWLHLLSKGHFSENNGIGQKVRKLC